MDIECVKEFDIPKSADEEATSVHLHVVEPDMKGTKTEELAYLLVETKHSLTLLEWPSFAVVESWKPPAKRNITCAAYDVYQHS